MRLYQHDASNKKTSETGYTFSSSKTECSNSRNIKKEEENNMKNRKIDEKKTKQVVVDQGLHLLLKLEATRRSKTIKTLLEGYIADGLYKDKQDEK